MMTLPAYTSPRAALKQIRTRKTSSMDARRERECAFVITVFSQLTEDLLTELISIPQLSDPNNRYDLLEVRYMLNKNKMKIRRMCGNDAADAMEDMVCEIVDACDSHVRRVKSALELELVSYIKYEHIKPTILLSVCAGLISCVIVACNSVKAMAYDFNEMKRLLAKVSNRMGDSLLNGTPPKIELGQSALQGLVDQLMEEIHNRMMKM